MASENELAQLLRGRGAHVDSLACVEDLPHETATRRAAGFPHSISGIIFHLNYWMDCELRRIAAEKPAYPQHAIESWPAAEIDPAEWREIVDRYRELLDRFSELAQSSPEELKREIEPTNAEHRNLAGSLSAVLWQIVAHNSYHVGQIVLLRQVLGAWPPPRGGDTW